MANSRFLLDVRPRDAETPGFHDLHLDADRLMREFRGEPRLDRLCRKMGMTCGEVLKTLTPGASVDPATGRVSINAGYNPGFDEGALEAMIWSVISREVDLALAGGTPHAKRPHVRPKPGTDDRCHVDPETRQQPGKGKHQTKP